jgi:hypothetical protein
MEGQRVRQGKRLILLACSFSVAWLVLVTLPIALYQYFAISTPQAIGSLHGAAWTAYLAPLELIRWTPTISSVDPLVTLIPSLLDCYLYCGVLCSLLSCLVGSGGAVLPNTSLERTRDG